MALTKKLVKALISSGCGAAALDQLADVERVAIAAEKVGIKGTGELKDIAGDLGGVRFECRRLVDLLPYDAPGRLSPRSVQGEFECESFPDDLLDYHHPLHCDS